LSAGAIERSLGPLTLRLQGCRTLAEYIVEFDDAVFDRAIKPPQAFVTANYLDAPTLFLEVTPVEFMRGRLSWRLL
jgi:hypothetical protein